MKNILFCLDFDGTLAPIAKYPNLAKLKLSTRQVLRKLNSSCGYQVAIVSGRSVKDVRNLVGIKGLIYVGNHGLEAAGGGISFIKSNTLKSRRALAEISRRIKQKIVPVKGVYFEDKVLSLSLHYRMVPEDKVDELTKQFMSIISPYKRSGRIKLTSGKRVWEIRPPVSWNKGDIALWLMKKMKNTLVFYFGDDKTDEDAFRMLKNKGITVKVGYAGSGKTCAEYALKDSNEVRDFLNNFLLLKKEKN